MKLAITIFFLLITSVLSYAQVRINGETIDKIDFKNTDFSDTTVEVDVFSLASYNKSFSLNQVKGLINLEISIHSIVFMIGADSAEDWKLELYLKKIAKELCGLQKLNSLTLYDRDHRWVNKFISYCSNSSSSYPHINKCTLDSWVEGLGIYSKVRLTDYQFFKNCEKLVLNYPLLFDESKPIILNGVKAIHFEDVVDTFPFNNKMFPNVSSISSSEFTGGVILFNEPNYTIKNFNSVQKIIGVENLKNIEVINNHPGGIFISIPILRDFLVFEENSLSVTEIDSLENAQKSKPIEPSFKFNNNLKELSIASSNPFLIMAAVSNLPVLHTLSIDDVYSFHEEEDYYYDDDIQHGDTFNLVNLKKLEFHLKDATHFSMSRSGCLISTTGLYYEGYRELYDFDNFYIKVDSLEELSFFNAIIYELPYSIGGYPSLLSINATFGSEYTDLSNVNTGLKKLNIINEEEHFYFSKKFIDHITRFKQLEEVSLNISSTYNLDTLRQQLSYFKNLKRISFNLIYPSDKEYAMDRNGQRVAIEFENKEIYEHRFSELLKELYPKAQIAIGTSYVEKEVTTPSRFGLFER